MSLLLINPPLSRYDCAELAPPLGLLTLARAAGTRGIEAEILDLNLPCHREAADDVGGYGSHVLNLVGRASPSEVGITSMGVNSHLAISLANLIQDEMGVPVTLGGIHLSSIAEVVERLCPRLPCVATPAARAAAENRHRWWAAESAAVSRRDAREDLQALFAPVNLDSYFAANPRRLANLETGRGCKYNCAFCYSPVTHDRWLNLEVEYVTECLASLRELGFAHVFLVQDNLFNHRKWLEQLARQLTARCEIPSWNGYGTLPDLTSSILPLLAEAGCNNLYIGIDAVDESQQKAFGKRFFRDRSATIALVEAAVRCGIVMTCAFIIDPDEIAERATIAALDLALDLRRTGADIRLSVLTPYPQTRLFGARELAYSEARPSVLMDLPLAVVQNPFAKDFIEAFPWHARPAQAAGWECFLLAVNAAQTLLNDCAPDPDASDGKSGEAFWLHCKSVARAVSGITEIHKTELKSTIRRVGIDCTRRIANAPQFGWSC
jgi:hypothetical protein